MDSVNYFNSFRLDHNFQLGTGFFLFGKKQKGRRKFIFIS